MTILIALGSNLPSPAGSPKQTLCAALKLLNTGPTRLLAYSPFYLTAPIPPSGQPDYVNSVARISTSLAPEALLLHLHALEATFERVRSVANAARTLDLDLLAYGDLCQEGPPSLPHPRLAERAFVLVPLADVAPGWIHPRLGQSVETLRDRLPPQGIRRLPADPALSALPLS